MQKNLIVYFLVALFFIGCSKDDGPVPEAIGLERVPAPLVTMDPASSAAIDLLNLGSFSGKFNVGLYFPNDIPPSKFDIVVRKNTSNSNVKVLQAGVTSFPSSFTVTAAQLATLFGAPVVLNDIYDVGVDVYSSSGKKYEAFPAVGLGYAAAFQPDHPGFNTTLRWSAICKYSPTLFGPVGSTSDFDVITDEWGDDPVNGWGPTASYRPTIKVTVVDDTHLSFKSPVNGTSTIVLTINPANNNITYAAQPYGDLSVGPAQVDASWVYGPATLESAGLVNTVAPCDKKINLEAKYKVAIGTFTNAGGTGFKLVLKQK
jgi:hypothetical protein